MGNPRAIAQLSERASGILGAGVTVETKYPSLFVAGQLVELYPQQFKDGAPLARASQTFRFLISGIVGEVLTGNMNYDAYANPDSLRPEKGWIIDGRDTAAGGGGGEVVAAGTRAAIQAAWDALPVSGGLLRVLEGSPVTYDGTMLTFSGKQNAKVVWPKSSPLLFPANATAPAPMLRIGDSTVGGTNLLGVNGAAGDHTVSLSTNTAIVAGSYVDIRSNIFHQPNRVKSISGAGPYTVEFYVPLLVPFATADASYVAVVTNPMENFELEGLHVKGNGNTGNHVQAVLMQHCPGGRLTKISGESFDGCLVMGTLNYKATYDAYAVDNGSANQGALRVQYECQPHFTRFDSDRARSWSVILDQAHGFTGIIKTNKAQSRGAYLAATHWGMGEFVVTGGEGTGFGIVQNSDHNQLKVTAQANFGCGIWFDNSGNNYNYIEAISRYNDPTAIDPAGGDLGIATGDLHNVVRLINHDAVRVLDSVGALNWGKTRTPTYEAAYWTSNVGAGDWAVGAADVEAFDYDFTGKIMHLDVRVITSTVTNTPTNLRVGLPLGKVVAKNTRVLCHLDDNGTLRVGLAEATAGNAYVIVKRQDGVALANAANTTGVAFHMDIEVI